MTSLESASMTIEEGIDFMLYHFEAPIWSRTVSPHKTAGRQILV
jgi:hypothetical protein